MKRTWAIVLALLLAVALVSAAEAQARWFEDPHGDTFGSPPGDRADSDLTDASQGHSGDRLVHVVKLAGRAPDVARDDREALLFLDVAHDWGATFDQCDYFVDRSGDRAGIYRCGTAERIGTARVAQRNGNGIRFSFDSDAIGDPSGYDWAVAVRGVATGEEFDRLPDGPENYHRHEYR